MAAKYCRACGEPIVWIKTPKDKYLPCDPGLIPYVQEGGAKDSVVTEDGEVIRCRLDLQPGEFPTGLARLPHWATCPNADEFRKQKQQKKQQQ